MPTPCATHLDCAKNSDMLSSIESLVVQKALSDAARAFCDPSHFSKASVVARRSRIRSLSKSLFFGSAPNTHLSRFSNSKASDAALCPPCLHLAISCQLPLAKHSNPKKKQTCLFPRGAFRTKTASKTTTVFDGPGKRPKGLKRSSTPKSL